MTIPAKLTAIAARARLEILETGRDRIMKLAIKVAGEPFSESRQALPLLHRAVEGKPLAEREILLLAYFLRMRLGDLKDENQREEQTENDRES